MSNVERGWADSVTCSIVEPNNLIIHCSNGDGCIVTNTNLYVKHNQIVSISMDFIAEDKAGIVAYKKDDAYLLYALDNGSFVLKYIEGSNTTLLSSILMTNVPNIYLPSFNEIINIGLILDGDNVICTYGPDNMQIFNTTQNLLTEGYLGIYGANNQRIVNYIVDTNMFSQWNSSFNQESIVTINDNFIKINNMGSTFSYIYQDIVTTTNTDYTFAIDIQYDAYIEVVDAVTGLTVITSQTYSNADLNREALTFNTGTFSDIRIKIGAQSDDNVYLSTPMLEMHPFETSYVSGNRANSILTFPMTSLNLDAGGIGFWFTPKYTYTATTTTLFYIDDLFKLEYISGVFTFTYGTANVTETLLLNITTPYYIAATWDNGFELKISIWNGVNEFSTMTNISSQDLSTITTKVLNMMNNTTDETTFGIVDNITVITGHTTTDILATYRTYNATINPSVLLQIDFDNETLEASRNKIVIPEAKPFAPIIVQDEGGTVYERVFFRKDDEYTLETTESFSFNQDGIYLLQYNDIASFAININGDLYYHTNANIDIFDNSIEIGQSILDMYYQDTVKEPAASVIDRTIYVQRNMATNQAVNVYVDNEIIIIDSIDYTNNIIIAAENIYGEVTITYKYIDDIAVDITYTPSNVYCINYNNGVEFKVSNPTGANISVLYEKPDDGTKHLVTTVDANPYSSSNNNGFIYITDVAHKLVNMIYKVSPALGPINSIEPDGDSVVTIIVDCYGENNVPTSFVSLQAERPLYGTLSLYTTEEEDEFMSVFNAEVINSDRKTAIRMYGYPIFEFNRSGRYVYKYKPNKIDGAIDLDEEIRIVDTRTQIGIIIPIRIFRL